MIFKSVQAYIEALRADPELAMIPMGLVAELKGISRSAVAEQIKAGTLEAIEVRGTRKTWRGVRPAGLFAQTDRSVREAAERRRAVADTLAAIAAARRVAPYSEVMEPAGMKARNPRHRAEIGAVLSDLSRESLESHGFLVSAVVVQKATGQPNELFFQLARTLGVLAPAEDERAFWLDQCARVFAHYADGNRAA